MRISEQTVKEPPYFCIRSFNLIAIQYIYIKDVVRPVILLITEWNFLISIGIYGEN